jgi:hypothetical protein
MLEIYNFTHTSSSLRCDNEGFCNGKESTGFCQCPLGYSGPHCEVCK